MLNEQQKRVLTSIHLRGITGSMGSMNKKQRVAFLMDLVANGYLSAHGTVTSKAHKEILHETV